MNTIGFEWFECDLVYTDVKENHQVILETEIGEWCRLNHFVKAVKDGTKYQLKLSVPVQKFTQNKDLSAAIIIGMEQILT